VKQAVIAGLGYSLIPLIGTKNELLKNEIHILPARGLPITNGWRLIWLKNKKLSPVAQEFLNFIQQQKNQIIEEHFSWYLKFK
jgi:DNA-binding transcriptional LysR family regulator